MSLPHEGDAAEIYCATTQALDAGPVAFAALVEELLGADLPSDGNDDVAQAALTAVADWLELQAVIAEVEAYLEEVA